MKRLCLIALGLAMLGLACPRDIAPKPTSCSNCINFAAPAVGQQSRYLAFEGEASHQNDQPGVDYLNDTLTVTVISEASTGFLLEEFHSGIPGSSRRYLLRLASETLSWIGTTDNQESWLLNKTLPLSAEPGWDWPLEVQDNPGKQRGWVIDLDCSACVGYIEDYQQLGTDYPRLNVWLNNEGTFVDGPGYTYLYNSRDGLVRSLVFNPWTSRSGGWDRLAE
jgi:hypothetical protein